MIITQCKVCELSIPPSNQDQDYNCSCGQYMIRYFRETLNCEILKVNNWYANYYHISGNMQITFSNGIIRVVHLGIGRLTSEVAKQWIEKLKMYSIFQ